MKASLSWLKDYIDIKMHPGDLAEMLTMTGVHVASLEKIGDDFVFDFEITSNRNDCLSILGIAREIAAVTGKKLKIPKDLKDSGGEKSVKNGSVGIRIQDKDLCPRYTGRVIRDIKVSTSPAWLIKKLQSVGMRPVNNVVDTTNFLLMETGQPMHAFDLDKIEKEVIIRRARKGEAILTIDGNKRTLEEGMLVIADAKKPVAVAGVMGGADTEVNANTKNILLESALFDPISVRRTSRALGLSSESSYRFERKIDTDMITPASLRAAHMIEELAGGEMGELADIGSKTTKKPTVKVDPDNVNTLLGVSIPAPKQKNIIEALNFTVKKKGKVFNVTPPSSRRDISQEVDITEEIARIYGYNRIPQTIPGIVGNTLLMNKEYSVKKETRKILSSMGLSEIMTYNLIPEDMLDIIRPDKDTVVRIKNPLSLEQAVMTQTLLLGMIKTISWNINRKNNDLALFEIGKSYKHIKKESYQEELRLSIGLTGLSSDDWLSGRRKVTFFDLKGIAKSLLEKLGIEDIKFVNRKENAIFSVAAGIEYAGEFLGVIGKADKGVLDKFDIKEDVYIGELSLAKIVYLAILEKKFRAIPKFPPIIRDISILANENIIAENIVKCIKDIDIGLVKRVSFVDMYKGKQIPDGMIGLLYRIEYRDDARTLTDQEVESLHNRMKENLASKLGVSFR